MIGLSSRRKSRDIWISDGSWSIFTWIERECDFTFHDLQEPQTLWMTIFPIFVILREKLGNFCLILRESAKITGIECESYFTI